MVRRKAGQSLETTTTALRGVQPVIREATIPPDWRPEDQNEYFSEPFTLTEAAAGTSGLRTRYQTS